MVRVTVNLTDSDVAILTDLAGISSNKTAVLRRSIATLRFVSDVLRSGRLILIETSPGRFREVLFPL